MRRACQNLQEPRHVKFLLSLALAALLALAPGSVLAAEEAHEISHGLGATLSPLWVAFFVLMLLAIAILPLQAEHWWESNLNKFWVCIALGLPVLILYLFQSPSSLVHTAAEYASFLTLLTALFVISGGILLTGDLRATPLTNTAFLAVGTVLASFTGTTGASMLLIRPLLMTNAERVHKVHTFIFFIFTVSNIGGCLTPLGDPPLFMGYLRGVPFQWTFSLLPEWLAVNAALLAIYFIWDSIAFTREPTAALLRDKLMVKPLRFLGNFNWPLIGAVVLSVAFLNAPYREAVMIALLLISLWMTAPEVRRGNRFTWYPMIEVAVIFFGIFLTMIPALEILRARGHELGVTEPWQFFWATGLLSSFLDNTPTYLTFFSLAEGMGQAGEIPGVHMPESILRGISLGAVFMGANTYIGNAPNFMVRSIAQAGGIRMPSFFGFFAYAVLILMPIFVVVTVVFL
jgi:Na+/H+ antiporter NhaD/arsenite permease-like protein